MAENSAVATAKSKMLLDSLPQLAAPQLSPQQKADLTQSSPSRVSSPLPWPSTKPHRKLIVPADTNRPEHITSHHCYFSWLSSITE